MKSSHQFLPNFTLSHIILTNTYNILWYNNHILPNLNNLFIHKLYITSTENIITPTGEYKSTEIYIHFTPYLHHTKYPIFISLHQNTKIIPNSSLIKTHTTLPISDFYQNYIILTLFLCNIITYTLYHTYTGRTFTLRIISSYISLYLLQKIIQHLHIPTYSTYQL